MNRVLIVVEDVGQQELVARILSFSQFQRVFKLAEVNGSWASRLVPTSFPHKDRRLTAAHPVPLFLSWNDNIVCAILIADGDGRLIQQLVESQASFNDPLTGCAILVDADFVSSPSQRYSAIITELKGQLPMWHERFPVSPGLVNLEGDLRAGIFVLPDNQSQGTLETLLLRSAKHKFPRLHTDARSYVDTIALDTLLDDEKLANMRSSLQKPGVASKATVDAIAAVISPGKDVAFAIKKQDWLERQDLELPEFASLEKFLTNLFIGIKPA